MYFDSSYVTETDESPNAECDEYDELYCTEDDVYDCDGEIDACNDERVWDAKTEQFRDRSDVWCSFEDDDE